MQGGKRELSINQDVVRKADEWNISADSVIFDIITNERLRMG